MPGVTAGLFPRVMPWAGAEDCAAEKGEYMNYAIVSEKKQAYVKRYRKALKASKTKAVETYLPAGLTLPESFPAEIREKMDWYIDYPCTIFMW